MTLFLATLLVFSVVIVLMCAGLWARRATSNGADCSAHCPGCARNGAREEGDLP